MKRIHIVSFVVALSVFFGCVPDHRNDKMPEPAVYFVKNAWRNGPQTKTIYSLQKDDISVPVAVYGSGFRPASDARVSVTGDESYIEYYNRVKGTSLKPLPADCWTLDGTATSVEDRNCVFDLKLHPQVIFEYAKNENLSYDDMTAYVISLRLDSENTDIGAVADTASLGYYLLSLNMKNASAQVSTVEIDKRNYYVDVKLSFENEEFNVSYDLDFGKEGYTSVSQSRGNYYPAKYRCAALPNGVQIEGAEVTTMAPGTDMVRYKVTFPEVVEWEKGKTYNYYFSIKNAMIDGSIPLDVEDNNATISLGDNHKQKVVSSGQVGNYGDNNRLADTQSAYYGKTLNEFGLESYTYEDANSETEELKWYWHPQSSCQYGGRDMCKKGLFDGLGTDWAVAYNNGGYGYDELLKLMSDDGVTGITWGVIDMKKVLPIEGIEYWRKPESTTFHNVKTFEFYALDACTYEPRQPFIEYGENDITYLGRASFGDATAEKNVLAATFDRVETQYLLILFSGGAKQTSYQGVEVKLFH